VKKNAGVVCSVMLAIAVITGTSQISIDDSAIGEVVVDGKIVGHLLVSPRALELIGDAEGCRLEPYKCPAGLTTDGIGNTHNIKGKRKTIEQVSVDWVKNISNAEKCLSSAMSTERTMTQGQFDAFTSFIFNTGCTVFSKNKDGSPTRIYKHIQNGRYKNACNELRFWVFTNGVKLKGLVNRRRKETEMCFAE